MSAKPEEWKAVPGHGGRYIVSSSGRVAKLMKGYISKNGYRVVALSANRDECKLLGAHQIVMSAFAGPANGMWIHHKDNDKAHNEFDNLEYLTPRENTLRAFEDGLNPRGQSRRQARLTWEQVKEIRSMLAGNDKSQEEIAAMFGVHQNTISYIHTGKTWRVEHEQRIGTSTEGNTTGAPA
jgi:predicted XRE-type DNA-binding protein